MNKLKGVIKDINSSQNFSIVEIDINGMSIYSIILETPETANYLKNGKQVLVLFKETEVSIGKNVQGLISLRNQIPCKVKKIEKGDILSKIDLECKKHKIVSIITTGSVNRIKLDVGDEVIAFIKSNEVSLMEI